MSNFDDKKIISTIERLIGQVIDEDKGQIETIEISEFEDDSPKFKNDNIKGIEYLNNRIDAVTQLYRRTVDGHNVTKLSILALAYGMAKIESTPASEVYKNKVDQLIDYLANIVITTDWNNAR